MKNVTTKLMIAAALAAAVTGVASAQSLRTEIPFAFRAGDTMMAPGTYSVRVLGATNQTIVLKKLSARDTKVLLVAGGAEPSKAWKDAGVPMLSFECANTGRCQLRQIWTGSASPTYTFPHHNTGRDEQASIREIPLVRAD